jgi:hypothetical protein
VVDALHEFVLICMADDDRAWFESHPSAKVRYREAFDHEFCRPDFYPQCEPAFPVPPALAGAGLTLMVTVTRVAPGFRTRQPYWVVGEAA